MIQILEPKLKQIALSLALALSSFAQADGGVSGGGGGSLPANPATPESIHRILNDARAMLYLHFNTWSYAKEQLPYADKLFESKNNIFSVLTNNKIHRQTLGPCIAPDGNGYDGSAPGPIPNSICISVERLTMKLSQENAYVQIYGLVAHEYAHLSGLNEEEATDLQRRVVDSLIGTLPEEGVTLLEKSYFYLKNFPFHLVRIQNASAELACYYALDQMKDWSTTFFATLERDEDAPFFYVRPDDLTQFIGINSRLSNLVTSLCAVGVSSTQERAFYKKSVEDFFKGKETIDLADIYTVVSPPNPNDWLPERGQVILRKVLNGDKINTDLLKLEIDELNKWTQYFFKQLEATRALREKN